MYCCFDDIITVRDIYFSDILSGKKIYKEKPKNNVIYDILCKFLMSAKPLRIRMELDI